MPEPMLFQMVLLGGLAFVLVTMVLYTLAVQFKQATARHDLIYEARRRRQAYLDSVAARQGGGEIDDEVYNVDIVDDEEPIEQGLPIEDPAGQIGLDQDLRQAA
jgi:hypothetical protein